MADDASFWSEIDESLRAEKLQQLWVRHSGMLLAMCALIVLASAGSVVWKNHLHETHERQTSELAQAAALVEAGKEDAAMGALEKLEQQDSALAGLAGLHHAQILLRLNQEDKALALYRALADGKEDADKSVRDFAALQAAILARNMPHAHSGALKTAAANGIFNSAIAELNALSAASSGDTAVALLLLSGIVHDDDASFTQRARAEELLESLKEPGK